MKAYWLILFSAAVIGSCLCCDIASLLSMEPLEVGTTAPELTLSHVDGEEVSLSDFKGQVVLLNFWSTT